MRTTQMTSFTSLLVVTDLSIGGNNAVRRAAILAQEHGARLHILHMRRASRLRLFRAWLPRKTEFEVESVRAFGALRDMAAEITATCDLTPTVGVVAGDPIEILGRAAERSDLVVLGCRGDHDRGVPRVDSAAARMIRACPSPVLIVKNPVQRPYQRVLVSIDLTACSDAALRVAAGIQSEGCVHVLYAFDSCRQAVLRDAKVPEQVKREIRVREEEGVRARVRRRVASLALEGARTNLEVVQGPVALATLQHARQIGADLIVAGHPVRSTVARLRPDSVGDGLLTATACDVLIVPEPRSESRPQAAKSQAHWIHNSASFMPRRPS